MQNDLIAWYINYSSFTDEENSILETKQATQITYETDELYDELETQYFNRMPFCNLFSKGYHITFNDSGTSFINNIFDYEVDDNTLVISTTYEHGSVQARLNNIKNKLLLNSDTDIRSYLIDKILLEAKKYKKVFVYIIGTQLCTGEITPQDFFIQLKEVFDKNNISYKLMLDDVHGMFLVPRDYSIFDYVLYTAHAIVPEYEMGVLISKDGKFGKKAYNLGKDYLKRLDIILSHKDKILLFKQVFIQYFNKLIANTSVFRLYDQTVEHIFAVETTGIYYTEEEIETLEKYKICVSRHNIFKNWLRIRYQEFNRLSVEKALTGLTYLIKLLNKKIMLKNLKED